MNNWKRDFKEFSLVNGLILGAICVAMLVYSLPDLVEFNQGSIKIETTGPFDYIR